MNEQPGETTAYRRARIFGSSSVPLYTPEVEVMTDRESRRTGAPRPGERFVGSKSRTDRTQSPATGEGDC